ncbi:MAG: ABC transporter ATP-binding protein [Dehalococcoidales bacterium]|nr:ABC transporter ATP-binding protein [Dehalococcoidales bacterium]
MTTAAKKEIVLDVKNLKTYFYTQEGELKAVDGLSYYIEKGESIGVVGESACGKSVSALSILRLIPYPPGIIVGGEILFQGQDLLKTTEEEMRHIRGNSISMVFQEPTTSLNPVLTVSRQISESLELHRDLDKIEALQETIRLLKLVGIPDAERRATDYPFQFSGGMQQRIMIAMGLACSPALLIADEPTTSLDVTVQAQLLEIIDDMRRRLGTSVIIITHNLGIVARYVDRVNVMYAGRMVETAPTEELYSNPLHPYTIGLLASVPRLDIAKKKSLRIIKGLPPNLAHLPSGCSFHPRCDYAMPICREKYPPMEKVGENHYRTCFADINKLKKPQ